jgi:hypothetical protein
VIQELRIANTKGSPTLALAASLMRTRLKEVAAAAQPASTTAQMVDGFGVRVWLMSSPCASAEVTISLSLAPFSPAVAAKTSAEPLRRDRSNDSRKRKSERGAWGEDTPVAAGFEHPLRRRQESVPEWAW